MNIKNRTIYNKDNLDILRGINNSCIDLIYLDPPFNKNKEFTAPIGSSSEGASFKDWFREEDVKDDWLQEIKEDYDGLYKFLSNVKELSNITQEKKSKHYLYNYCYLCYMGIRLLEMRRILKDTGSIYLHCDPTMSHYLKILMDIIFGEKNFRNEITWQRNDERGKGSQHKSKKFGDNSDIVFFYTKSDNYFFDNTEDLSSEEALNKFNLIDEKGRRYYSGIPVFRSKSMGSRPNLCYEWKGFKNPHPSGWRLSKERLEEEYQKGNIVIENGKLERRKYIDDYEGKPIDNNWHDISRVMGNASTGYPTQKPLALLKRIIKASSNKGDMVLDPFCGCSTTCVASEDLKRQWVGIDISVKAYELVKERLKKEVQGVNEQGVLDATKHQENDYDKEVKYTTTPPNRTDLSEDDRIVKKYVYIISHPNHKGYYKVGIASNKKQRLNSYQTGDPLRQYKMEYDYLTPCFREIEKHIHDTFPNLLEWVQASKEEIVKEIEGYEKNK